MAGNRNKRAGHDFECQIVNLLKDRFKLLDVSTSRRCNRVRDGEKVDITHQDEAKYGRLFIDIQAKRAVKVPLLPTLEAIKYHPDRIRVVLWDKTYRRSLVGGTKSKMFSEGEFAFLTKRDLRKLGLAYEQLYPEASSSTVGVIGITADLMRALNSLPEGLMRIVLWDKTVKTPAGIATVAEYAFMIAEDFYKLLGAYIQVNNLDKIYQNECKD
jgi:hypothetical protein